jgi:dihydrofolate reductase
VIASIWAQNADGVIGVDGRIPWYYKGDFKRFKRVTSGATVIMGRVTYESIGKPLSNRTNIVVTSTVDEYDGCIVERSIEAALKRAPAGDVFFIGGARIYAEAMRYVDLLDITYVPDAVPIFGMKDVVYAPSVDETVFEPHDYEHEDEPNLRRRWYVRRSLAEMPYDDPANRRLQELGVLSRRPA